MSSPVTGAVPSAGQLFLRLLPLNIAVFTAFLVMGLAMPVLPLHVHDTLAMSATIVGVVVGMQFIAALLSRGSAGALADARGGKRAVMIGFCCAVVAGLLYLLSLRALDVPWMSVSVLLLGRVLLGCAESLCVTGALTWGLGVAGIQHAGKVMGWNGMAMYGAYAVGAPAGVLLYRHFGFIGLGVATVLLPLLSLAIVMRLPAIAPVAARRAPFYTVIGKVWLPGSGLALCCLGFSTITAFIALLFAERHWPDASLAFTIFGVSFVAARVLFGHLPDRIGGAKVALVCVLIEALGQVLIWGAPLPWLAYVGAGLSGWGYSLAFPAFGVEAVKRAPPENRGAAMGGYAAFYDLAAGFSGPLLGLVAGGFGFASVFLLSTLSVAASALVALRLLRR